MRLASAALSLSAVLLTACSETATPPIVWEGEFLRFGTDEDLGMVCGGTLPHADRLVAYLAGAFGHVAPSVDYYWVPGGVGEYCSSELAGCTHGTDIFSEHVFLQHELVHAARGGHVAYPPLEEGLAEYFGDDWKAKYPLAGDVDELWSVHDRGTPLQRGWYPIAGHYASFLRYDGGMEKLADFARRSKRSDSWDATQQLFEEIYGESFASGLTRYQDYPLCDQTWYRDGGFECGADAVVLGPTDSRIELDVPMGCDEKDVLGPRDGERWKILTFEVPTSRTFAYGVAKVGGASEGSARFRACDADCFSEDAADRWYVEELSLPAQSEPAEPGLLTCIPAGRFTMRLSVQEADSGGISVVFEGYGPC